MQPHHYIGLDLGQPGAFTAWAVVERSVTEETEPVYALRHLDRFALGTPFTRILQEVGSLIAKLPSEENYPTLLIDQTGVGKPVVDLFRRTPMRANITPVCITAGQQASTQEDGTRLVPKVELVSCLQVLLQGRRLRVARDLPAAQKLARELQNFRMKVTLTTGDNLGAWRENQHDDLVLAVALACWMAEREPTWGPNAFSFGGKSVMADAPPCESDSDDSEEDW